MPVIKGSRVHNLSDMVGQRFGRLTVLRRNATNTSAGKSRWDCFCECGQEVTLVGGNLKSGVTKSCGCLATESRTTHGLSKVNDPTYAAWNNIRQRCNNPHNRGYAEYGGRGIRVCARWNASFEAFLEDMGAHPGKGYSIDRINNDGNYEFGNCRWANAREQANNRSDNKPILFNGRTMTLSAWARELGVNRGTLSHRLLKGWSIKDAFTTPVKER